MMGRGGLPPNVRILSTLPPDHPGFSITDKEGLRALSNAEDRHFWFSSRNRFLCARLTALGCAPPAKVLELGCGGGAVSAHLSRIGYRVTGVDGHLARVREAAQRAPGGVFFVHDLSNGTEPFGREAYEAVGLFDVLEHLDQPGEALIAALQCARPGGLVVGTVPALMALWSEVDVQAGHRLRYDERSLVGLLHTVPCTTLVEVLPFHRALVPMLWLQRRLFQRKRANVRAGTHLNVPPALVNRALDALARVEQRLAPALDQAHVPGASLWFALRKHGAQSTPVSEGAMCSLLGF